MHRTRLFIFLSLVLFSACKQKPRNEIRDDFKKFYDEPRVKGSFVLYDQKQDKYIFCNQAQSTKPFTPASTFKICNALIALETGVIKDERFVIAWDSVIRDIPDWNKDHDLKSAFRNSTVWYFQELARRVGAEQMKYWLDSANYGNADTSGGIDKFWLWGGLRITPMQQIDFLKRLHGNQLPFSKRSMEIVKEIMISDSASTYVMRAKTGWGIQEFEDIGWCVGYVEAKNNVYYFSNCIQYDSMGPVNPFFAEGRVDVVYAILKELKIIQE